MSQPVSRHVVVIGAGIIGAATAEALIRDGHRVTLVEPGLPGGEQAASFGNGAFLSPASIMPMSTPGIWMKVPGYLLDPAGALTIRWRFLPRLLPWLVRFLLAGATRARVERTAATLASLLEEAPALHRDLADRIGRPELIRHDGLVYAYADRAAFAAEGLGWELRRRHGVRMQELDREALAARVPSLSPRYGFGILLTDGSHCTDPGGYVAALADWCMAEGATLRRTRATGFDIASGRLRAVLTEDGPIACDRAVIAAGIRAKALAKAAGDAVPLESERGYHVEVLDPAVVPEIPVLPADGRMANVRTRTGLRAAGQVELASADAPPDWHRADILLDHLKETWPGLGTPERVTRWQGNRPSTPDGRPVIGRATHSADILHAFGHGHIGLASAPMTAALITDLIAGRPPRLDIAPLAAARFR